MEEAIVGFIAFLAVTLIGFGLFGRPDQSRPTCIACGADARPFAWSDPPQCGCGKRLDRAGAVRSHGRIRRPHFVVAGVALGAATVLLALWTHSVHASRLHWMDVLPLRLRVAGLRRGAEWAIGSAERRRQSKGVLGPQEAAALIAAADEAMLTTRPPNPRIGDLRNELLAEWIDEPTIAADVLPIAGQLVVASNSSSISGDPAAATRGGSFQFVVRVRADARPGYFVRVERVELDGRAVPWTLECYGCTPTRIALVEGHCRVSVPEDQALGTATLTVEMLVVRSGAAWAALGDELIDSDSPPESWGVKATVGRVRRTLEVNVVERAQ